MQFSQAEINAGGNLYLKVSMVGATDPKCSFQSIYYVN